MDREYRLHAGARSANTVVGVLCCVLVVGIPLGICVFVRGASARVRLDDEGLSASGVFASTAWKWRDVARIGVLRIAVVAGGGAGGAIARQKVGGDHATHLVVQLADGRRRSLMVSMYERMDEIVAEAARLAGKPLEELAAGNLGVGSAKWPGDAPDAPYVD